MSRDKKQMRLIVTYWRDIPSMVTVKKGREKGKVMLADRFQEGIDRAAMRAGKGSSDAYIAEWRSDTKNYETDLPLTEAAQKEAEALEAQYDAELLKKIVKNNGHASEEAA